MPLGRSASRSVARDADTMRGPAMVAGRAGLLSVTTASVARRWPGGFRADNPHGDGNRRLALAGTLRAVVGMDDGRRLGGHGAIVGQSPDMKSRQGGGMLPVARRNAESGGVDAVPTRGKGFYWVGARSEPARGRLLGTGGWWLAGDAKPWQPEAVTVVSGRLIFRPRTALW